MVRTNRGVVIMVAKQCCSLLMVLSRVLRAVRVDGVEIPPALFPNLPHRHLLGEDGGQRCLDPLWGGVLVRG